MLNSSLLAYADEKVVGHHDTKYNNPFLRVGTVVKIIKPSDKRNQSKLVYEYDVVCVEKKGAGGMTQVQYRNCIQASSFGSAVDFTYSRLIAVKNKDEILNGTFKKAHEGAQVLLLMVDGFIENPIIIGTLPNSNQKKQPEDGSFAFQYNDVNLTIGDDKSLTLSFLKTNTIFSIDKTGTISLSLKDGPTMILNSDKSLSISTPEAMSIDSKILNITVKENTVIDSKKGFNITSAKSAIKIKQIKIDGSKLEVKMSQVEIKAQQLQIKASAMILKGSQVTIDAGNINLGNGGLPALNMLTQFIGTGNQGGPVISSVFSGFSSKVFIAS